MNFEIPRARERLNFVTEKQSHQGNGAPESLQDWPTLVGRAVDDVTRILQSEAHLLQASIGAVLHARLASAVNTLVVVAVMLCGGVCMLYAAILLLHEWLPLWQAFGIAGTAIMLIGIAIYAMTRPAAGFDTSSSK